MKKFDMPGVELGFIIVFSLSFICLPLMVLGHELGHSFAVLVLTPYAVTINMVNRDMKAEIFSIRWKRLNIKWRALPGFTGNFVFKADNQDITCLTTTQQILIYLAGPLVTFLLFIICSTCAYFAEGLLERLFAVCAISQLILFMATFVPIRYPMWFGIHAGKLSDGGRVFCLLRKRSESSSID